MANTGATREIMAGLGDPAFQVDGAMRVVDGNAAAVRLAGSIELSGLDLSAVAGPGVCEDVVAPCLAQRELSAKSECNVRLWDGTTSKRLAYAWPNESGGAFVVLHDAKQVESLQAEVQTHKELVQEYHDSTMELAIGISELFEVLSEMRKGNLDARVSETTLEGGNDLVAQMGQAVNRTIAEIQDQLELIQRQQFAIQELSTPILQVWDQVLALPVVGVVDSRRAAMIMERLLSEIKVRQARYVILDITGVEVVDTKTADQFIKVIRAAELLGTKCILTGIGPAVAQTLVDIGVDLSTITTLRDLQDALWECLHQMQIKASASAPITHVR